jgi:hypothetical protein
MTKAFGRFLNADKKGDHQLKDPNTNKQISQNGGGIIFHPKTLSTPLLSLKRNVVMLFLPPLFLNSHKPMKRKWYLIWLQTNPKEKK